MITTQDHITAAQTLLTLGEERRLGRVPSRPVIIAIWDGNTHIWRGVTPGEERDQHRPQIRLGAARGWNCTCTDRKVRGKVVGPCKHVLSLATEILSKLT